jgi:anthranilate synthase/aminodeoxychorismate synthase-like glutamine amidotransferase
VRILLVDNYDSFTWNLAHYLEELGVDLCVVLNDEISVEWAERQAFDAWVISPGPGAPDDSGVSLELARAAGRGTPLLGVCLGHQAIGMAFGGRIVRARSIMHGKVSSIEHDGCGILAGIESPMEATRYHSLVIDESTCPEVLEITARTADGEIMGVRHRERPIEGVQFHPESILTRAGKPLLRGFLDGCARALAA